MREILFRGKRLDNGKWVYGNYIKSPTCQNLYMIEDTEPTITDSGDRRFQGCPVVDPDTVGQYTGLCDTRGTKIFEGDIVEGPDFDAEDGYGVVRWDDGAFEIENLMWCGTFHENYDGKELEVIGNIHDNPELMDGGDEDGKDTAAVRR